MSRKKPLLSEVLEYLKDYKEGVLLDKTISIFNNEDELIKSAKLSRLNAEEYQSFKVVHYYQLIFNPDVIKIWVSGE